MCALCCYYLVTLLSIAMPENGTFSEKSPQNFFSPAEADIDRTHEDIILADVTLEADAAI